MRLTVIILFLLTLVGCGSSNDEGNETFTPRTQELQSIKIVDATGNEIVGADVTITEVGNLARSSIESKTSEPGVLTSDENGNIQVSSLLPGIYQVTVVLDSVSVNFLIRIEEANAIASATVLVPISVIESEDGTVSVVNLSSAGVFFSLSGLIFDNDGPVSGAQISLSGGSETNGAINTVMTDDNGAFSLIINVKSGLSSSLQNSTIRIVKDGYDPVVISGFDATSITSISGMNIQLEEASSDIQPIYLETFNAKSEQGVCGSWIAQGDAGMWHEHGPSLAIQNQAYVNELVVLAPDDISEGYIPDPLDGYACWYGKASGGGVEQGNFLGDAVTYEDDDTIVEPEEEPEILPEEEWYDDPELGGTSVTYNSGAIMSPEIDLRGLSAPLSLHFKTWWEIESVNPNQQGFDIMSVDYTEDGEIWFPIARLNPFSDPVDGTSDLERAPYPFTNNGFNEAPGWIAQEPIPLDALANKVIRLRIKFGTVDYLYNGFRGWLIDDIAIYPTQGTFPLIDEDLVNCDQVDTPPEIEDEIDPDYCMDYGEPVLD